MWWERADNDWSHNRVTRTPSPSPHTDWTDARVDFKMVVVGVLVGCPPYLGQTFLHCLLRLCRERPGPRERPGHREL
ncbi:hypothetical protein N656DRAFT_784755 [Canariomyces notabilis]|uniref:Uncharacterized protein n=1 Tax=Canariomyces notabilis TaxID=2074819 RepID=A0AAN6T8A8_9PEZI|nr:hypothetical protein N656DRAFT_784755 [Canariomyces arenarius]